MPKQLSIAAAALFAYGWSLAASFHFDDFSLLLNPLITTTQGLWRMWGLSQTRPLTNLTFWIDYHVGGSHPVGYHAVNLLLHIAAAILLYQVLRRLLPEHGAFVAALLFAVHPAQSEAVAYVFARSTLLCTLLCLVSLWFWLEGKIPLSVALFAAALLAKEECVTFPFILLLLTRVDRMRLRAIALMLGLAMLAGIRATWATSQIAGSGAGFTAGITPWAYVAAQGSSITRYLRLLILPWGFTIDPTVNLYALCWGIAIAATLSTVWAHRKGYSWAAWMLCGLILLIPSSTIFPATDLAADRRMYLPMIGFTAALSFLEPHLWRFTPSLIATVLAMLSIDRCEAWRTEESLWREATHRSPTHIRPLLHLAHVVPQQESVDLLVQAKFLEPKNASVASELGRAWLLNRNPAFALQEFGRALALEPRNANAYNNRGAALLQLKQENAAQQDFQRALKIDPCVEAARRNLIALGETSLPPCTATATQFELPR